MNLNAQDGIPMMGTVNMTVRDALTHRVIKKITIRNKITFLAADMLVELLAQRTTDPVPARNLVYSMRMGTSNTAAARSDTNLGAYVIGKALVDVNKVNGVQGEITFIATLESADGNGNTFREAGLFSRGPTGATSDAPGTSPGDTRMVARQVHPPVVKSSSVVIDYSWTLAFTAVP